MMETIKFCCEVEIGFDWEEYTESVCVEEIEITVEEMIDILLRDKSIEILNWSGNIISRNFHSDVIEKVNEPAYGGYGNTGGISEMGPIVVDREFLLELIKKQKNEEMEE